MVKQILIAIIMIGFWSQGALAQKELVHYYIQIDGKQADDFNLSFGVLDYDDKYYPVRRVIPSLTLENFSEKIADEVAIEGTSQVVNMFIHGIWAESPKVWEFMMGNISRDILDSVPTERKICVSIIWDSSFVYGKGVKIASAKGAYLGDFFRDFLLSNEERFTTNLLCHSMGNRVFQHMVIASDVLSTKRKLINEYAAVAADLEANIFQKGEPLEELPNIINRATVYVHNNDRTLMMSKLINGNKRLGLHGPGDLDSLAKEYNIVDVSIVTDNEDLPSSLSNHRYFYMSPAIREELRRLLWAEDNAKEKKVLDHPRRVKLKNPTKDN